MLAGIARAARPAAAGSPPLRGDGPPQRPTALHGANTYWVGLAAGIRKGGGSLERVTPSLEWGDGLGSFTIHKDGRQIGNLLIGHSDRMATFVMISGLYASDTARFEALLAPKLQVAERYGPASTGGH